MKTLLSVIIPVFNRAYCIKQCAESVLAHTGIETEIILVDDYSKDETAQICNSLAKQHTRVKFYRLEQNAGPGTARNTGVELAKGQFITFLDSDDKFSDKTQFLTQACIDNPKTDIFVYDSLACTTTFSPKYAITSGVEFPLLLDGETFREEYALRQGVLSVWRCAYRAAFISQNNIRFSNQYYGEDLYFSASAMLAAENVMVLPYVINFHRESPDSQTATRYAKTNLAFEGMDAYVKKLSTYSCDIARFLYRSAVADTMLYAPVSTLKDSGTEYGTRLNEIYRAIASKQEKEKLFFAPASVYALRLAELLHSIYEVKIDGFLDNNNSIDNANVKQCNESGYEVLPFGMAYNTLSKVVIYPSTLPLAEKLVEQLALNGCEDIFLPFK